MTYAELTTLVRNWCNRDEEVVSDSIIQDSLRYAADKAYRKLRVPPLENVAEYAKAMNVNFSPRLHLLIWDMALKV